MKIVCINNEYTYELSGNFDNLTVGEIYKSVNYLTADYLIHDDNGELIWFDKKRFISLKEYRKLKLDKINELGRI